MKHTLMLGYALLFTAFAFGQVTMQVTAPSVIEPTGASIQIKLNKGAIAGFARYQIDLPVGVIAQEEDNKGGNFASENNHAKIFWASVPTEPEITISIKLLPGKFSGIARLTQKFYYMENGEKKETEGEAVEVTFKGEPKSAAPANPANSRAEKLQAEQLKKDSKAAYNTGLKEQDAADKKLAEANDAIKKAEAIPNEAERQAALKKAYAQKQKAETDKAVASKILALARTLDENAAEIERLNKTTTPAAGTSSNTAAVSTPAPVSDTGTVYRLQLGAFAQNPEKALSKHLGLISIVNENGMYKVLMGRYATREEAARKRDELVARSFDCFVVTYTNGVRVK